ncbi:hypothetical protein ACHAXA_004670 [Cyclostephanos tholiformis]|uniref:Uncharacterized protein n=1 Tax=Cyclostephanos tholiformis TaxID=382380 RepID=A0ABD3R572_9STRA
MRATEALPTLLDENGRAPDDAHTTGIKAHVPGSDRRIALSAIDNQINAAKVAWKEKNADEPPAKVEFFISCIDRTGESLKRQLESTTVALDEAKMEGALNSFRMRLLSPTKSSAEDSDGDGGGSLSSSSVDDVDEEYEFEDDDIVDRDAYDQVKRLRAQAREVSSRVVALREETTGRALDMTRRDLSELLSVHGFSEGDENHSEEERAGKVEDVNRKRIDSLNPMHVALQTLVSSLQTVDSDLTEKLDALKETIETIDSSIEKFNRLSQGDVSALSRTEKALLSIQCPQDSEVHSLGEETESPMNPDKKLARLLAGVL